MKCNMRLIFFIIAILGLFVFSCFVLFTSIHDICKIRSIIESSDENYALIVNVLFQTKKFEKAVYFKMADDEKIYRTHIITNFSKKTIEPGQIVQVKSDKKAETFIIIEFIPETYTNYIFGIILSICGLLLSIMFFVVVKRTFF